MAEKLDYSNLGFAYHTPEKRYVSNYKNGAWDEGGLSSDLRLIVGKMDLSFASVRI